MPVQADQARPPLAKKKRARNKRTKNAGPNMKADSKPASGSTTTPMSMPSTTASIPSTSLPAVAPASSKHPTSSTNLRTSKKNTQRPVQNLSQPIAPIVQKPQTLIDQFFARAQFSGFNYSPAKRVIPQFYRMCEQTGLDDLYRFRMRVYEDLIDVLVLQFNLYYGTNADDLGSWQDLCRAIGIVPYPDSLVEAREAVIRARADIIDLIEYKRIHVSASPTLNSSPKEARISFPSEHPRAGGVLRLLTRPVPSKDSHISHFFEQDKYARYRYNPSRPIMEQYYELRELYGWGREDPRSEEAWKGLREALVLQFNSTYGEDIESRDSWLGLCHAIGIKPECIPESLEACREMIAGIHVNIVDLLEFSRNGDKVQVFITVEELSQYTIKTGRYFPRNHALAGGVLRYLLRYILDPSLNYRKYNNRSGPRKRRGMSGPKPKK